MPQRDVGTGLEPEDAAALDEHRRRGEETGDPCVVIGVEPVAPCMHDPLRLGRRAHPRGRCRRCREQHGEHAQGDGPHESTIRRCVASFEWSFDRTTSHGFTQGFRAAAPLWLGVVPFALVYAVVARDAGLSLLETQALSVLVFAGSAQFSAVGLFGSGAAALEIVSTTFLLNVRHVLYGLSLGRRIPLRGWRRADGGVLPHGRGVRRRRRPRGAHLRVPARGRAEPLRDVEPRDARRGARRHGDHRPGGARASTSSSRSRSSRSSSRSCARASSCSSRSSRVRSPTSLAAGCPAGFRSSSPGSPGACSGPR